VNEPAAAFCAGNNKLLNITDTI